MKFDNYIDRTVKALERFLPDVATPPVQLHQAMHYVVMGGGKRIRALLVYATGEIFGAAREDLDRAASAVEFIHAYSLTHDDLPAMDDDTLRRGKPTCHVAYDEATAILVGDALQCLAFDILVENYATQLSAETRLKMLSTLTQACSSLGMAGGQALDLSATGKTITLKQLADIHQRKTGALINASIKLGALAGNHYTDIDQVHLNTFAENIGLAFQIHDDILDVVTPTEILGKQQGKDISQSKATYPSLMGMDLAIKQRDFAFDSAIAALENIDKDTMNLKHLAQFIVQRIN